MRLKIISLLLAVLAGFVSAGPVFAGSVHGFGRAAGNCGGVWRLPDTGQTVSYTATYGEDHDYQPAAVQPGYKILNPVGVSSVTVDNITGLMWVTNMFDTGMGALTTWESAIGTCEGLNYATYTDWRLPNIKELLSIVNYSQVSPTINTTYFLNTISDTYWSSTIYAPDTNSARVVNFNSGTISTVDIIDLGGPFESNIRCVRGGP